MRMSSRGLSVFVCLLAVACGDDSTPSGQPDAAIHSDAPASTIDARVDAPPVDGSPDAGSPDAARGGGLIGSACTADTDCAAIDARCIFGFCTRPCGGQNQITTCNEAGVADPNGPLGGIYTCWQLGYGRENLCWPNGSGATCGTCPRAGEQCIGGQCQYGTGTTPRTDVHCHRDTDCVSDEACAFFGNLEPACFNIRSEGACLYRGQRQAAGATCTNDSECGSFMCNGTCIGMCLTDADCSTGTKCSDVGITYPLWEFDSEFVGLCLPWAGSRTACTANSDCASGETCAPYQTLVNFTQLAIAHACQALPNPAGAASGAACTMDSQCASATCVTNALTGLGYCQGYCGGDADCQNGSLCRQLVYNGLDPSTTADDVRTGFCVQTAVGQPCFVNVSCKSCTQDSECMPAQGVNCVSNICRDRFGRCANPCRHDCSPGGSPDCPTGFTCTWWRNTYFCQNDLTGECLGADLFPTLSYEHGMCGDTGAQDLCYYHGRVTGGGGQISDVFMCGQACTGATTCPQIPTSTTPIATTCRTVHEFGIGTGGGAAFSPTQCAPSTAFGSP